MSFVVDARGASMTSRRHSGVRITIPPGRTCQPTRIVCKLVRNEKLTNPPQLAEGEALASKILDMGQAKIKFNGLVDRLLSTRQPIIEALFARNYQFIILYRKNLSVVLAEYFRSFPKAIEVENIRQIK